MSCELQLATVFHGMWLENVRSMECGSKVLCAHSDHERPVHVSMRLDGAVAGQLRSQRRIGADEGMLGPNPDALAAM